MSYSKNIKIPNHSFQVNTELIYQSKLTIFMFLKTRSWSYWASFFNRNNLPYSSFHILISTMLTFREPIIAF